MPTGGCFCGHVRYESAARPFHETTCHCQSCRKAVGAASVAWFTVPRASLRFTGAAPTRFESSAGVIRTFCPVCGTSLTFEEQGHPDETDVTIASLDDPAALPPRDHSQVAFKLAWELICDGLPAFPERRPPAR